MPRVIDKQNVVNSRDAAPDKLRAEIGLYTNSNLQVVNYVSNKINTSYIPDYVEQNNQLLIPTKKQKIFISGVESQFRDYTQWKNFVLETIKTGISNLDHTTDSLSMNVTNTFNKNYHRPQYEDSTKILPSNQLINYNLFAYRHKNNVESIRNIADIRTRFDSSGPSLDDVFDQIRNRLDNYTSSVEEISTKQRNIFKLTSEFDNSIFDHDFPFMYIKEIDKAPSITWPSFLRLYKKDKNVFQSIHRNLSSINQNFLIGDTISQVKLYDAISLMTSTSNLSFQENPDETFLLNSDELNSSNPSERFVNSLNSVLFLQGMRNYVKEARNIEQVFNLHTCDNFILGYKIEKYLDRDVTGPIQTYYSSTPTLKDTQIKYGRKYIYKTKVLLGVLGSSYRYSNLVYRSSDSEMVNQAGDIITNHPEGISEVSGEKYYAYVDVVLTPSFKILEYEIEPEGNLLKEVAFIDSPTMIPHVDAIGCIDKPMVKFKLTPRSFTFGQVGFQSFMDQDEITRVGTLRESDIEIADLYEISGEKIVNPDYFTGIYEVYRMEKPPQSKSEFVNYYLATVDNAQAIWLPAEQAPVVFNDMNAMFSDKITPNRKYYYAFRALTYHGTPSELTEVFEVELLKDSNEYKVNIKTYNIPEEETESYKKSIKRIIRLVPNPDRLIFNDLESTSVNNVNLGSLGSEQNISRLVDSSAPNNYRTFKLRVTSKHTGKKIDINIQVKLIKTTY